MKEKEFIYLVWLHSLWFTNKKLHQIFEKTQNYKEIFDKISTSFLQSLCFNNSQIEKILDKKYKINLDFLIKKLEERNVKIITIKDENFPEILKEI